MTRKVLLSWSSGKDSAWTLYILQKRDDVEVVGLLTTLNEAADRVVMHAVRYDILRQQAESVAIPLWPVMIPSPCPNETYEQRMGEAMQRAEDEGVTHVAFGDLFLEDVRDYRIKNFEASKLKPIFPIWQKPTDQLARQMVDSGIDAWVTCVDPKQLDSAFVGRKFDHQFLEDLPDSVDPCGENGEFHTCVLNGPMYRQPITANVGEIVERDGFFFADLIPGQARLEFG